MEAGLVRAREIAGEARGTQQTRIVLFTDVQPNVGATAPSQFEEIAREAFTAPLRTRGRKR